MDMGFHFARAATSLVPKASIMPLPVETETVLRVSRIVLVKRKSMLKAKMQVHFTSRPAEILYQFLPTSDSQMRRVEHVRGGSPPILKALYVDAALSKA
jgi:hypothetical protein